DWSSDVCSSDLSRAEPCDRREYGGYRTWSTAGILYWYHAGLAGYIYRSRGSRSGLRHPVGNDGSSTACREPATDATHPSNQTARRVPFRSRLDAGGAGLYSRVYVCRSASSRGLRHAFVTDRTSTACREPATDATHPSNQPARRVPYRSRLDADDARLYQRDYLYRPVSCCHWRSTSAHEPVAAVIWRFGTAWN